MRKPPSIFDLGFGICDLGLRRDARANPKSKIQNPKWIVLAFVVILSLLAGVAAAEVKGKPVPQKPSAFSYQFPADSGELTADSTKSKDAPVLVTVGSFIFKLAVVLGLAYASIYALKRFSGLRNAIGGSRRHIKVVENASLGTNRSLHLIEVGAKRLLVASTPSQISLLTELGAEEVDSEQLTVDSGEAGSPQPVGFAGQLASFMGSPPKTGEASGNIAQMVRGSSTFLQEKIMQLGRLRRKLKDG
jgi:flagellar biosynthetic protein FliO